MSNVIQFRLSLASILDAGGKLLGTDGDKVLVRNVDGSWWEEEHMFERASGEVDLIMERIQSTPMQLRLF